MYLRLRFWTVCNLIAIVSLEIAFSLIFLETIQAITFISFMMECKVISLQIIHFMLLLQLRPTPIDNVYSHTAFSLYVQLCKIALITLGAHEQRGLQ